MKILFLDDNQSRHNIFKRNSIGCSVDHVYTAFEAMQKLNDTEIEYDVIFLDHDLNHETENKLNEDEEDGRFVAKHLSLLDKYKTKPIIIHSLNNIGGKIMMNILKGKDFSDVHYVPFAWEYWKKDNAGQWGLCIS